MGNLHNATIYSKEYADKLDKLFEQYCEADRLAEHRGYRDPSRNRRVEELGVDYDRMRAEALAGAA